MAIESSIPTLDALPPMAPKVRDALYGLLAWAAGLLTIASAVILAVPEWDLTRPVVIANIVINGLWTLGGFKAKGAVSNVTA